MKIRIRLAEACDVPVLRELIEASVRGLQAGDYSAAQLENALRTVYGVDTQLISDGTYFAAEETESSGAALLVGCGGWSKRTTLYGGDLWKERGAGREDSLLDPAKDAAKIRAFFVHPAWARRGIGGMILEACEAAAEAAGFSAAGDGSDVDGGSFLSGEGVCGVGGGGGAAGEWVDAADRADGEGQVNQWSVASGQSSRCTTNTPAQAELGRATRHLGSDGVQVTA
ncbi:MAG: GNAT family N-acetyltransferase [Terriglobales bacterium]